MSYWEHFPHGSDIGIRGVGPTLTEAFVMIAHSLTAVMTDSKNIAKTKSIVIKIESESLDFLLYDWINRIIYESGNSKMIFSHFEIEVQHDPPSVMGTIYGENTDLLKNNLGVEVKGATFTELKVQKNKNGWTCQCVVDV